MNGPAGVIKHYIILGGGIPCGKFQYQMDIAVISRTISNKYAAPRLWFPVGNILTDQYFCIKDVHRTAPNMERVDFIVRKDSTMKEISRRNIGGGRHMVVQVCIIVNSEGTNSRVNLIE